MGKKSIPSLQISDIDRIMEMAWEGRTTLSDIKNQYGIYEKDVIAIMKKNLKRSSFLMWRQRVRGRKTKILPLSDRFKSSKQKA